jgi:hypothetical protein
MSKKDNIFNDNENVKAIKNGIDDNFILRSLATRRKNDFAGYLESLAMQELVVLAKEMGLDGGDINTTIKILNTGAKIRQTFEKACEKDIFSRNYTMVTSTNKAEIAGLFDVEKSMRTNPKYQQRKDILPTKRKCIKCGRMFIGTRNKCDDCRYMGLEMYLEKKSNG